MFLHLKFSKTDQFWAGCTVVLVRSDDLLCPVSALMSYLWLRGRSQGLPPPSSTRMEMIWRSQRRRIICNLCLKTKTRGPKTFFVHGFIVVAATAAALLGFTDDYLNHASSHWTSDAFKLWIKLPQESLIDVSWSLVATQPLAQQTLINWVTKLLEILQMAELDSNDPVLIILRMDI